MLNFYANPRDGYQGDSCSTCCCESATARPGETNRWEVNYIQWVIPQAGRGLTDNTSFEIELIVDGNNPGAGNQPPSVPFIGKTTAFNTPLTFDLTDDVTDPESNAIEFKLLSLYGPDHGDVTISPLGVVVYTPKTGYVGYDRFYYQASDDEAKPVVGQVMIGVAPDEGTIPVPTEAMATKPITIRQKTVIVDNRRSTLSFAVETSPAAISGSVYRLTIRQQSLSCEGEPYWHISCYDIKIGKC